MRSNKILYCRETLESARIPLFGQSIFALHKKVKINLQNLIIINSSAAGSCPSANGLSSASSSSIMQGLKRPIWVLLATAAAATSLKLTEHIMPLMPHGHPVDLWRVATQSRAPNKQIFLLCIHASTTRCNYLKLLTFTRLPS